ncbi:T3SS effector HopA1 family protein [Corynebacterium rouxii]|uniref:Uncharacterized protein n=1 Tax=Corynebacterium rouxii TaxID=2719119 RepID=A0A6I8MIZ8_9CORY|nr:T3SS effector HopA1 family protein [Corynebacterium rouxii]VZH86420.1 hypothetical protein FRC0190_02330 [Corynebacterium rouxii]
MEYVGKRSDDIVFYFQNEEHYTIAKKLVVNADTKIGSNDKNSIFTESIRGGISCAVDDLRQERDDLSFGQKKSRELAEKVIHFLQDFRGN